MIILLSGEGPTDLGHCNLSIPQCSNDTDGNFISGVLTYIINGIFSSKMGYSLFDVPNSLHFVHKTYLCEKVKSESGGRKMMPMRGVNKATETSFYYNNARALGLVASELSNQSECHVIAILFRDSDGTRSTPGNDWDNKYKSMINGFSASGYDYGVPMLAKPKSEAWLLAACKDEHYQHCHLLEDESGNDSSSNPLKDQLAIKIGGHSSQLLIDWLQENSYDHVTVANQMPSFGAFYTRFLEVLEICCTR